MGNPDFDLLIVGGGINGTGIARDAAGRGLSVALVEKDDLASHTSSASSKLIHGGLRYLEHGNVNLVRQSLAERERLLRAAPHIVEPLQFVLPLTLAKRPAWIIRAGLFLYDHLSSRKVLPGTRSVDPDRDPLGVGLRSGSSKAFTYWDCKVQDSRLVILNAVDAAERGATILPRTELLRAGREDGFWKVQLRNSSGDRILTTRALVNAAGPWASQLFDRISEVQPRHKLRLVKGSHIVLPALYEGEHAFVLQNPDGRVVFAIPYEAHSTLIGTTEVEWVDALDNPSPSEPEVSYLLDTARRYFARSVEPADVVWSFAGIRSLVDDGRSEPSRVTRDYALELDAPAGKPPLLSVFGGKITTYRRLAEQAVDRLSPLLGTNARPWTECAVLPGGNIANLDVGSYAKALASKRAGLPSELIGRLVRTYGTRTESLLGEAQTQADLGQHFGSGLYEREVDYLVANEWAHSAEDILFRRTKLGLHLQAEGFDRLDACFQTRR